jgi:Ca-activated chloride channel family protein
VIRGIGADEYPSLLGYVATTPKPRAETPLWTDKGDPLLAHWQYGLGRAVAFTSDAKSRWAKIWLNCEKYKQFWSQIAQWSLRRLENADFTPEVTVENGQGHINVEALDEQGNYRNFLTLQTVVVSPKGEKQTVRLEQTGPGHYEAPFSTKEVGAYLLNLMDMQEGKVRGSQVVGASVNYSPEFKSSEPNYNLLRRITETAGGKSLELNTPALNTFEHDRRRTFQPRDLWEWLLEFAILLFIVDVGVRRIQIDRDEMLRAMRYVQRKVFFWQGVPRAPESEESLAALLARRDSVRSTQTSAATQPSADLFRPTKPVTEPLPGMAAEAPPAQTPAAAPTPAATEPAEPGATTTSRLLEAKRRAQRRKP